ncbi:hypothetical protein Mp_7g16950 [Marchantia polymorpha subsp. ruderalis]|uniref:WD repeat-containing protein 44 n=2 Tax=Marchantia polymorpha TaxID=3197 RepID=A0AAF6C0L3_MARPO|nr:hypothetical protein MARPO_0051s0033 [Marchantia polymorpha]PTQ38421.1 hypothetical protein MARPO_0051s0033 [Marchantia polymorpha]BBN17797.1 hypothetical protein Mp_7g16950 [Marchantia polymorpha subsp. ruderalis]BBN17798.1 hypothetical protein Mp_7g16950 [Marchantia polymorpha subsp. ruderalis]|eukprot:PTQ38420.1 hypothetical protein MARPO_0051s0033 [Marchantia polymorpha]
MEASSDDEFHEAKDEISSQSGSESPDEEGFDLGKYRSRRKEGQESPRHASSWYSDSRFSVWQDGPKSIHERRRLLYERFGIPDRSIDKRAEGDSSNPGPTIRDRPDDERQESSQNRIPRFLGGSIREHLTSVGEGFGRGANSGTSGSHGNGSSPRENSPNAARGAQIQARSFEDEVPSGSDSATPVPGIERLTQTSGAVLREGKWGPSSSKPPIGSRAVAGLSKLGPGSPGGTQIHATDKRGSQVHSPSSSLKKKPGSDSAGTLSPDTGDASIEGSVFDSANGHSSRNSDGGLDDMSGDKDPALDRSSSADENNDTVYKIKDLDSGKEFIIDELESKLREMDTGKEISLEEFESALGLSPVMQELRRREREKGGYTDDDISLVQDTSVVGKKKKKTLWVRTMKGVAKSVGLSKTRSSTDALKLQNEGSRGGSGGEEREGSGSVEKSRRMSTSHDSVELPRAPRSPQRVKVHVVRKSHKEFSDLHLGQEIHAHQGAIWTMKFSTDGRYLATAGHDRIIHIREVIDHPFDKDQDSKERVYDSADNRDAAASDSSHGRKGPVKASVSKKKAAQGSSPTKMPKLFWLSEKPVCSFKGHTEDVLDLSWSQQQHLLLSSSMDKTVRLWHISDGECLRTFIHSDYVTCIDFSPTDARYFMSGSLDDKVRMWNIHDNQVVDWSDVREMVTAASFSADGKRAAIGTYKGTCRFYNTTGHKLHLDQQIDVRNAQAKKGQGKKITGLQFMPGEPNKLLITSHDSRIRVYDGKELHLKFKGLRNVNSQIAASFNRTGEYIISASEDSRVYVWNSGAKDARSTRKDKSQSYEHFASSHVSIAIPWPGMGPQPDLLAGSSEHDTPIVSSRHSGNDSGALRSSLRSSPGSSTSSSRSNASSRSGSGLTSESVGECKSEQSSTYLVRNGSVGSEHNHRGDTADEEVTSGRSEANNGGLIGLFDKSDSNQISNFMESPVGDYNAPRHCGSSPALSISNDSPPLEQSMRSPSPSFFADNLTPKGSSSSATWPEEKLPPFRDSSGHQRSHGASWSASSPSQEVVNTTEVSPPEGEAPTTIAAVASWGLVIVTAELVMPKTAIGFAIICTTACTCAADIFIFFVVLLLLIIFIHRHWKG